MPETKASRSVGSRSFPRRSPTQRSFRTTQLSSASRLSVSPDRLEMRSPKHPPRLSFRPPAWQGSAAWLAMRTTAFA